jgi:hypothetical protein
LWQENKKVYKHMAYVIFEREKWVFLGLFFKKKNGEPFTGDKLAVMMSDPAEVNAMNIDENSAFVHSNALVRLVKLGECTAVYETDSGEVAFVERSDHRHLCYLVMDKVDLSPRKSEMTLHVKIINLPPPAAGGAAAGAAKSPTALPAAHAPAEESEEEEEGTAAVTASRSLRKSTRQTKLVEKGAAVTMKTPAAKRVPMQTPAAKRVRQRASKAAASNVTKKAVVQKRSAKPSAKRGGRRETRGAKGKSTAQASPLSVDEETHSDEEPDDSTAAQPLALPARGGRSRRPLRSQPASSGNTSDRRARSSGEAGGRPCQGISRTGQVVEWFGGYASVGFHC